MGYFEGKGKYTWLGTDKYYEGDFKDNKFDGQGEYHDEQGNIYIGQYKEGKRDGKGR